MDYFICLSRATASLWCLKLVKEKPNTLQQAHSWLAVRYSLTPQVLLLIIAVLLMLDASPRDI